MSTETLEELTLSENGLKVLEKRYLKRDINGIPVVLLAEFLHQPRLSDLSGTPQDQWFSPAAVLPFNQIIHQISFHNMFTSPT